MSKSVHRGVLAPLRSPFRAITLGAQFIEDFQDSSFGRVLEPARGNLLRMDQKALGFGQGVRHVSWSQRDVSAHGKRRVADHPRESRPIFGRSL